MTEDLKDLLASLFGILLGVFLIAIIVFLVLTFGILIIHWCKWLGGILGI